MKNTIFEYPLTPGHCLIEASAGTGKTFTIKELYRRLILEKRFKVNEILVVTFSKAAAAELKERIVGALHEALQKGWEDKDGHTVFPDTGERLLLELAIASFDEASISTIHSFCQKALSDFAMESGESFDLSLQENCDDLTLQILRDFWREKFGSERNPPPVLFTDLQKAIKHYSAYANTPEEKQRFPEMTDATHQLCREALDYLQTHTPLKKNTAGIITFDDLVQRLRKALEIPVAGERLAYRIRNRYKAVFVDEFQDTDEAQFQVFNRCFPADSNVIFYMIGDPKQAIYAFRDADIYAYLQAKNQITDPRKRFTLTKNFRSSPDMIRAVNVLFTGSPDIEVGKELDNAFLQEGIPFVQVESGKKKEDFRITEKGEPLTVPLHARFRCGTKIGLEPVIIADTAKEIASLLSAERDIRIGPEQRSLQPSDIAILVQKHDQSASIAAELRKYGINATGGKGKQVYETPEAEMLEYLMLATISPRGELVRQALSKPFFNIPVENLNYAAAGAADSALEAWLLYFREKEIIWREKGIAAYMTALLDSPPATMSVTPRRHILMSENGERAMTNYLHLMELLRLFELTNDMTPEFILEYLHELRTTGAKTCSADADSSTDPQSSEMRLDRDTSTVQLVTLFASKGLQYPIVFIPFPVNSEVKADYPCHVRRNDGTYFSFSKQNDNTAIDNFAMEEALRSQLRLLYVGITRAEYRCYIDFIFANSNKGSNMNKSASGALLLPADPEQTIAERIRAVLGIPRGESDSFAPWTKSEHADLIRVENEITPPVIGTLRREEADMPPLSHNKPPVIPRDWHIISYSSFHYKNDSAAIRDLDKDQKDDGLPPPRDGITFRDFPGGTNVGILYHNMMEKLARNRAFRIDGEELSHFCASNLKAQGTIEELLPLRTEQLQDGIRRALRTPLTPERFRLCDAEQYIPELEFMLDIPRHISLYHIVKILKSSGSEQVRNALQNANSGNTFTLTGLMNGFIDLIFRINGKYYIVDWKTNRLGSYSQSAVNQAMTSEGYLLQAYLYTTATVPILRQRDDSFSYENDFGGVIYLFPRGLDEHGRGIWFDKPPADCISNMLQLFYGGQR